MKICDGRIKGSDVAKITLVAVATVGAIRVAGQAIGTGLEYLGNKLQGVAEKMEKEQQQKNEKTPNPE